MLMPCLFDYLRRLLPLFLSFPLCRFDVDAMMMPLPLFFAPAAMLMPRSYMLLLPLLLMPSMPERSAMLLTPVV